LAAVHLPGVEEVLVDTRKVAEEPVVDPDGNDTVSRFRTVGVIDVHARARTDPTPSRVSGRWRRARAVRRLMYVNSDP